MSLLSTTAAYATEVTVRYSPKPLLIFRRQKFIKGPIIISRGSFYFFDDSSAIGKTFNISLIKTLNNGEFYAKIYEAEENVPKIILLPKKLEKELKNIEKEIFVENIKEIVNKLENLTNTYEKNISDKDKKKAKTWTTFIEGFDPPEKTELRELEIERLPFGKKPPIKTQFTFENGKYGDCTIMLTKIIGEPKFIVRCFSQKYAEKYIVTKPVLNQVFDPTNPEDIYLQCVTTDGEYETIKDPVANKYLRMMVILVNTHKNKLIKPGDKIIVKMPVLLI
jgi:hypothetical protein